MPMPDMMKNLMIQLVQRNQSVAGTPQAQEFIRLLEAGDEQGLAQMGQNLCQTSGRDPQQEFQRAMQYFGGPLSQR